MFGQHDDRNHQDMQNDNSVATPTEPVDDGTLGVPAPDSDSGAVTAPSVHNDDAATDSMSDMTSSQAGGAQGTSLSNPATVADTGDALITIKQEALHQLKPLVGHLEQTPEEKFRTTMMMIQASDDQTLIGEAYEAAKGITDEKMRAQALLDVVNEINYFTAQKG
jgi:hypothetical protein